MNFCLYCGRDLSIVTICPRCHALIPSNASSCPSCTYKNSGPQFDYSSKDISLLNRVLDNFSPAILVIFLLSIYFFVQLIIGSVFLLILPFELVPNTSVFFLFNLILMLVSNIIMITIISKWLPFPFLKDPLIKNRNQVLFFLLFCLIASISFIEILVTILDFGLDLIGVGPSQASPYDDFFTTPLNIFAFSILAVFFGPIFEELIFRRFAISTMLKHSQSKTYVVFISALIFSLSHTSTDILEGSFRYTFLHIAVTFVLGLMLGTIFLQYGLKYAIAFHSFWNVFSLIIQILIINELLALVDLIVLLIIIITIILTALVIYQYRYSIKKSISNITLPRRTEFTSVSINFVLIITYELLLPLILLSTAQNIISIGIFLLFQFCGLLIGILLINNEQRKSLSFNQNRRNLNAFNDELHS